jgi:hypothetical protein
MVTKVKGGFSAPPLHFASLFRGFYGRVARQLGLDPSYVSRVARGERQSETIEAALEQEMKRIIRLAASNHGGAGANHSTANHDGARTNHNSARKKQGAKKKNKVIQ